MHPLELHTGSKTPDTKFKTQDSKIRRGIICAGCSFTWGQGLYYYYNLPTIMEPPVGKFYRHLINDAHLRAMESLRYPRLLADKLNTFEVVYPGNGGANHGIVDYWQQVFNPTRHRYYENYDMKKLMERRCFGDGMYVISEPNYDMDEFAYITFQFTMPTRTPYEFKYSAGVFKQHIPFDDKNNSLPQLQEYLLENNITFTEMHQEHCLNILNKVKSFLQGFENQGVKARILSWPQEMVSYILDDPWMCERLITFHYKENVYTSLESLMEENREMRISTDPFFTVPPGDNHPSKQCHELIAESLLNTMDKNWVYR